LNTIKTRIPGLDVLRFIAFFKVFLLHLPNGENTPVFNFLKQGGGTGVAVFFVLSGFLISMLLIEQKNTKFDFVDAKTFFLRRSLRIWPLYFLGVILAYLGIFLMEKIGWAGSTQEGMYKPSPIFSFLFLENYKMIWENASPQGAPLSVFWSLCIEEHFYIFWIFLFWKFPLNSMPKIWIALWCFSISLRFFWPMFQTDLILNGGDLFSSFDYFVSGSLLAFYFKPLHKLLFVNSIVFVRYSFLFVTFLYLIFQHVFYAKLGVLGITISAIVYAYMLLHFAQWVEFKSFSLGFILAKIGTLTYGLYVFHTPVILFLSKIWDKLNLSYSNINLFLFVLTSFFMSLMIAFLSYKHFEMYFLRLRNKLK